MNILNFTKVFKFDLMDARFLIFIPILRLFYMLTLDVQWHIELAMALSTFIAYLVGINKPFLSRISVFKVYIFYFIYTLVLLACSSKKTLILQDNLINFFIGIIIFSVINEIFRKSYLIYIKIRSKTSI